MLEVAALYVYPLKSARGTSQEEAEVEARGLVGDRRWMVVDRDHVFVSQRSAPELALVTATLVPGGLHLAAEGHAPQRIEVPGPGAPRQVVTIWGDSVEVARADPQASAWVSDVLKRPCELVHLPDDTVRAVDPRYGQERDRVSLADGYPLLVTTEESLADLNERLEEPVPMTRFRPNIVLRGAGPAYAEDSWSRLRIGAVDLRIAKPCDRCVITTTDQRTGRRGLEPLRTLATYRRQTGGVMFGQNAIPDASGIIRVGDTVGIPGSSKSH